MHPRIMTIIDKCEKGIAVDHQWVESALGSMNVRLPDDYIELLTTWNGIEGFVGENYLMIWPVEQVPLCRKAYGEVPHLVFFGSDGNGEGYAYDTRRAPLPIITAPFIGCSDKTIRVLGHSILEFLERLERAPL